MCCSQHAEKNNYIREKNTADPHYKKKKNFNLQKYFTYLKNIYLIIKMHVHMFLLDGYT